MQQHFFLDLVNIQNIPYMTSELQAIIEQRTPCGSFSITAQEAGNSAQILGSGTYIKRAAGDCYIEVVTEEGTCQGLMSRLFPERPVRVAAYTAIFPR